MKYLLRVYDSPPVYEDSMFLDFGPYDRETAAALVFVFADDVVEQEGGRACVCVIPVKEE